MNINDKHFHVLCCVIVTKLSESQYPKMLEVPCIKYFRNVFLFRHPHPHPLTIQCSWYIHGGRILKLTAKKT